VRRKGSEHFGYPVGTVWANLKFDPEMVDVW